MNLFIKTNELNVYELFQSLLVKINLLNSYSKQFISASREFDVNPMIFR